MASGRAAAASASRGKPSSGAGRGGSKASRLDARAVGELLAAAGEATDTLCIVTGTEDALRRLVLHRLLAQGSDRDVTVLRVSAGETGAAAAIEHACEPTLFGGATWLFVTELDQGGDDVLAAAKEAVAAVGEDLRLVLGHGGNARGKGVLTAAEKAGARTFEAKPVAVSALPVVLEGHAKGLGRVLTGDAATTLVDALGPDLTALLAAVEQLASDARGTTIDAALVADTVVGSGSDNQFQIADLVWHREADRALAAFHQLADRQGVGSACVTVVAALSYSLRTLARYVAERPSGSPWQVASALGVPMWKVDEVSAQAKLWRPAQLARAAVVLAGADADAKGGLGDAGALDPEQKMFAVERLILQLAAD